MRRIAAVPVVGAALWAGAVGVGAPAPAAPDCGVNLAAPRVIDAVKALPPYHTDFGVDWAWNTDPAYFQGNYNPCATLSAVVLTIEGPTGSSPDTGLMFHNGVFVGRSTPETDAFMSFNSDRTTGDTVVLDYRTPGACGNGCPPAAITSVRYRWQGDHVAMLDQPPR